MFGKVRSLRELFEIGLCYAYDCEKKLVDRGLPSMIENANSTELRSTLEEHLEETSSHITRLEQVFSRIGIEPRTKDNDILDEMMSAAKDSASNIESSPLRDAALILNGNQVEHYEIALYGTLAAFAHSLGYDEAVVLLRETLEEEKLADTKLTELAETLKNPQAAKQQAASD